MRSDAKNNIMVLAPTHIDSLPPHCFRGCESGDSCLFGLARFQPYDCCCRRRYRRQTYVTIPCFCVYFIHVSLPSSLALPTGSLSSFCCYRFGHGCYGHSSPIRRMCVNGELFTRVWRQRQSPTRRQRCPPIQMSPIHHRTERDRMENNINPFPICMIEYFYFFHFMYFFTIFIFYLFFFKSH